MANTIMAQPVFDFAVLQMLRDRLAHASKIGETIHVRRPPRFAFAPDLDDFSLDCLSTEEEYQIRRLKAERLRCKNRLKEMSGRANYGAVAYGVGTAVDKATDVVNDVWMRYFEVMGNNLTDQIDSAPHMGWFGSNPPTQP